VVQDTVLRGRSDSAQIVRRGLAGPSISNNVEGNPLPFVKAWHPGAFDCADVHEDILAAVIWLDEAEAFLAVEPLHGSLCHIVRLSVTCVVQAALGAAGSFRDLEESRQSDTALRGEAKSFGRSSIDAMWGGAVLPARFVSKKNSLPGLRGAGRNCLYSGS
jgi:hypothetical protein